MRDRRQITIRVIGRQRAATTASDTAHVIDFWYYNWALSLSSLAHGWGGYILAGDIKSAELTTG